MYTYITVLRCIISVKILINGLFSYWIFLNQKKMNTTGGTPEEKAYRHATRVVTTIVFSLNNRKFN
jgi:hypothetical protein